MEVRGSVTQKGEEASGELPAREEAGREVTRAECGYDRPGRLVSERKVLGDGSVLVTQWGYDANGNRVQEVRPNGDVVVGSYDEQDRLLGYGEVSFTYTHNGELFSKCQGSACQHFTYDVFGSLRQVVLDNGQVIEYLVDGRNRRVGKKIDGVLVRGWLYDDQLRILAELDGQNNVVARFIYADGINVPELMEKGGRTYRLIKDQLGSVRLVVDVADGSIMQEMRYDAWGNVIYDSNPGFQPFGFAGGLHDPQTRLARFGARDYDASVGRWTAKDPAGFLGGDPCLYSYVGHQPTRFVDPSGLGGCGLPDLCRLAYYLCRCAEKSRGCGDLFRAMQRRCTSDDPTETCIEKWSFLNSFGALENCLKIPECKKAFDLLLACWFPRMRTWPPEVPGGQPTPPAPYRPPKGSGFPWPRGPWEDPGDLP